MNLGTQKWKKARANFVGVQDDAGRYDVACEGNTHIRSEKLNGSISFTIYIMHYANFRIQV